MRFGILGGLQVVDDGGGEVLQLGGPKQRAVLAVLLLNANRVVSLDRLIDVLWGDEPPPTAAPTVQAYVSNLRKELEPGRSARQAARVLVSQPPGYRLVVPRDQFDFARFEDLCAKGLALLESGEAANALAMLDEALAVSAAPSGFVVLSTSSSRPSGPSPLR